MQQQKGGISVNTENIFPVIKKWLYSDKDIFVREVLSNACDAITKHKRLVSLGETAESAEPYAITVSVDKEAKTLTFSDNGIGMTADEVMTYINQIALSGAMDFISKYEGAENSDSGIIGHFGLGFYSVFMVADSAEIITKSYKDEPAVHWTCTESGEYTLEDGERESRGTDIILHVSDDEAEYLEHERIHHILDKYCAFMPYPITFGGENVNDTDPIWQRSPSDVTDEEYIALYKKLFDDYRDPLLWVHINADYPLNFKGILYFPAKKNDYESYESKIKLFYNSVFVSDNIPEACPSYLINLQGVLDCPELPLNVSRSYLQSDAYIKRVAQHIAKKVADKLNALYNNEREKYEQIWEGIKPFIEYGCIKDEKFSDRVSDVVLFKKHSGGYCTLAEYVGDRTECTVYYASDINEQHYYIDLFEKKGETVLVCDMMLDNSYCSYIESKKPGIKFLRVDAAVGKLDGDNEADGDEKLKELFALAINDEALEYEFVALEDTAAPALISSDESSRRMSDMMRMYAQMGEGMTDAFPVKETLAINVNSAIIKKISQLYADDEQAQQKAKRMARHVWLSAKLLSGKLDKALMLEYVTLNNELLTEI